MLRMNQAFYGLERRLTADEDGQHDRVSGPPFAVFAPQQERDEWDRGSGAPLVDQIGEQGDRSGGVNNTVWARR
jgi:hypothetical protein